MDPDFVGGARSVPSGPTSRTSAPATGGPRSTTPTRAGAVLVVSAAGWGDFRAACLAVEEPPPAHALVSRATDRTTMTTRATARRDGVVRWCPITSEEPSARRMHTLRTTCGIDREPPASERRSGQAEELV